MAKRGYSALYIEEIEDYDRMVVRRVRNAHWWRVARFGAIFSFVSGGLFGAIWLLYHGFTKGW